jgi:hypothetical protein
MEFVTGTIYRDVMTSPVVTIPAWEVPVLEAKVGNELVEIERFVEEREVDPGVEYGRLERLYGEDPKTGISYVERVYGQFRDGRFLKALQDGGVKMEGAAAVASMDREALMALLDENGIEYRKNATLARLRELAASVGSSAGD